MTGYRDRMPSRSRGLTASWLLGLTLAHVGALVLVWWMFIRTRHGQLLDTVAFSGNVLGQTHVHGLVTRVLDVISVLSLAVATGIIGFIALARRRVMLAMVATLLVAGANLTTQALKHALIHRPDLGIDSDVVGINSLPSGHTTVAASVAVALVLVLPPRLRGTTALLGAGYAALTAVATLSAGWHRPSNAVAALIIVGGWAAGGGLLLVLAQDDHAVVTSDEAHPYAVSLLAFAGLALLAVGLAAVWLADPGVGAQVAGLSRRRMVAAYAGSAVGIAGTACLMMMLALVTVHRVVPRRLRGARPPEARARVGASA